MIPKIPKRNKLGSTTIWYIFYVDAKNSIGNRSILKDRSNENGNPQFTHDLNITVIWTNGAQAAREGCRIREWVESDKFFDCTQNNN
jgi:hypothetical protein